MSVEIADSKTAYALQQLARHQLICKMLADIATDMQICELEGWDIMEYPKQINENVAHILKKYELRKAPKKFEGRSIVREDGTYKHYNEKNFLCCSACDKPCGFFRDTCPNCGAKLDRSHVEEMEVKA